ncbi:cytochrome b-c1 complex subunit 10-like [Heptranchias perlo]|uniref:cytochrome b-c1 complex subunit 10-like n=1 Tax=Heptranchias perlo TaxID=212740 RepID=UPI00355A59B6
MSKTSWLRDDDPENGKIPTVTTWGAFGGVVLVYATDWRVIVDRIPYVRGKFKTE